MVDMGTLTMAMVVDIMGEDIMVVVATIDLPTDPIDQGLKTLSQDQTDQRPSHRVLLANDLLPGHHETRVPWEDHHEV